MVELIIWSIIFILSLAVLIKSSDYFTESAEKIGIQFGIPAFIVGVTIVSIGTSLPELLTSIVAVLSNSSEIVAGNVVGSNITNIFLVLGIAAIIDKNLRITYPLIHVDLPILIGSAFFMSFAVIDGFFTFTEALLCLAGFVFYIYYTIESQKKEKTSKYHKTKKIDVNAIIILILSAVFIYFGAKYTVESLLELSGILGIGEAILAASAVALGTSLPELSVSIQAARKGKSEIAIGNILGSNIFNSFAVMGIPALFGILVVPETILEFGIPMMLVATLMYFFVAHDRWISKWEGGILILFYILFIGKLFGLI